MSSGFRTVFPNPMKNSGFRGTSRLPSVGFKQNNHRNNLPCYLLTQNERSGGSSPLEMTLTLQFPAARTGFRSELGYALTMFPPRD